MSRVQQFSKAVLVLSLVGVLSGYASAAKRSDDPRNRDEFSGMDARHNVSMQTSDLQRASRMIGKPVKSEDGRTLGQVYDIVLTPDLNSVSYVALSRGGAFGLGRDLYAVPWSAFQTGVGNAYYLPITENRLRTMSGFKEAYWPTSPSGGWVAATDRSVAPAFQGATREEKREVQARRVSHIIGTNVKDAQGKNSGHIKDLIIAKDTGQIAYTIVSYGGLFGIGSRYAAVPPTAIDLQPQRGIARLTVDHSALVAGSFSPMQWPDLSSSTFEQRVATLYGTQPSGAVLGYVPPEGNVTVEPRANVRTPARQEAPIPETEHQTPATESPSPGSVNLNPSELKTIEGTIVHVGRLGAGPAGAGMLALRLKIADDKIVLVNVGPREYISKQGFSLMNGDHVAVTGADARIGWRHMFVATEVTKGGQILKLRDSTGHAVWPESTSASRNVRSSAAINGEPSPDYDPQNPLLDW